MRILAAASAAVVLAAASPLYAAGPSARVSSQEFLKAIQETPPPSSAAAPASGPAGAPASGQGHCQPGFALDQDGLCAPVVTTQGFTLLPAGAAGPKQRGRATPVSTAVRPHRSAPPPRSSRLADLLITFRLGSAELTDQGRATARNFAVALKDPSVSTRRFEIAGHTDSTGSADRNRTLSEQRAEAVRSFLVTQGVDPDRLEARGYGSSEPAVPSDPKAAANRRVEARPLG